MTTRSMFLVCAVPLVVTALLGVKVNTRNITTRNKLFQRSAQEEALLGHVILSTRASSDVSCLLDCSKEQRCLSFNYKPARRDEMPVCEINDETRENSPDSVVSTDGYYYYGPESSCTSDRCQNGGTCQPVLDDPDKRYQCQCLPGFSGQRCQIDPADYDISFPRQSRHDYVSSGKMQLQLTSFTISLFVKLTRDVDYTLVSYATPTIYNAIFFHQRGSALRLWVNNKHRNLSPYKVSADGAWHHVAVTWEITRGEVTLYIDGVAKVTVLNVAKGTKVEPNGIVAIGNDQDSYGGGFVDSDALCGTISRVNIWDTVLPRNFIASLSGKCGNVAGTAVAWKDFRKDASGVSYNGQVKADVPSTCKKP